METVPQHAPAAPLERDQHPRYEGMVRFLGSGRPTISTTSSGQYAMYGHVGAEKPDERAEALWNRLDRTVRGEVPLPAFAAMTSRYDSGPVRNAISVPQIESDVTELCLDAPD